MKLLTCVVVALMLPWGSTASLAGDSYPDFCAPVPVALLGGLAAPYAPRVAPDGTAYCEGLIRNPIALRPPTIVSVKQIQTEKPNFVPGSRAIISWCDQPEIGIHVRLRSVKSPLFALDAVHTIKFEWPTDIIAKWQPDWGNLAALGTRQVTISGQPYTVTVPLRTGLGFLNKYSFLVQSKTPIHLTTALIEPTEPPGAPEVVGIVGQRGPTNDTWAVEISFEKRAKGVFRLTLEENTDEAGVTTEPIYLLHGGCSDQ